MKLVYIAHPIGGDVKNNLNKVVQIGRKINLEEPDVVPVAQYFFDCHTLNDDIPEERERGIRNDTAILERGLIDEVWLYGNRISNGMRAEIKLAHKLGIPVVPKTPETDSEYFEMCHYIP